MRKKVLWTEAEDSFLKENFLKKNNVEIAEFLGRTKEAVGARLFIKGLHRALVNFEGKYLRNYSLNENYFDNWSQDMAYILGLWFADGNIYCHKKKCNFTICLHNDDSYLLEEIKKKMQTDRPLRYSKRDKCCSLVITSKAIVSRIIKLGGITRKSLVCDFPSVPKKYICDFIRGFFDGDGSIFLCKKKSRYGKYSCFLNISFVGGENFLISLKNVIEKICRISGKVCFEKNSGQGIFVLRFQGAKAVKILQQIYSNTNSNSLFMKRKNKIYKEYLDYLSSDFLPITSPKRIKYRLISPEGKEYNVTNLSEFCKKNCREWNISCVRALLSQGRKEYKGWSIERIGISYEVRYSRKFVFTNEQKQIIKQKKQNGVSFAALSREYGTSESTMHRLLNEWSNDNSNP